METRKMTHNADGITEEERCLFTLHRYFIWSNRMRQHFEATLRSKKTHGLEIESFLYMSYWYASLYVVVEGWQELGLSEPAVNELLSSSNVEFLKKYRHGVFHFRRKYFDEARFGPIIETEGTVNWIRTLHSSIGDYLLRRVKQINQRLGLETE